MMGAWTDAVEAKVRIIHGQISAARALAERGGHDPDAVDGPYLRLLGELYRDEYLFAQLVDNSDLVARFEGPAVDARVPTMSIVASMCSALRKQIQQVAMSVMGLATDERLRWPTALDPHLSGMAPGSLVVGVCIQGDEPDAAERQRTLAGVSDRVFDAVRDAVQGIATVTRHVHDEGISDSIDDDFPDPAVRDTVVVAASKLAPTGRLGISRLSLYGPDATGTAATPLTPGSRKVLNGVVRRPLRVTGKGEFRGTVRAIDLDARRFEIRNVDGIGAIRCIYGRDRDALAKEMLDAEVVVAGEFEAQRDQQPRLIQVSSLEVVEAPRRLSIADASQQARLKAAVAPLIGSIHDESMQAEGSSERVRAMLAEKHARSQDEH